VENTVRCSTAGAKARSAHDTKCTALRWEIATPFGVPVDPEV
jgi:hypothetical protein